MASNRVTFTVEFDSEVWASMTPSAQEAWVIRVNDLLSDEVYVSDISTA